ncbi:class I SAM-dependent methyltransferase [Aeromonas dhakensis]|uniref:class I SAM-dependent methyltransferase n=1 Tax=Aeromonas dhakensis TaxID=196024 RepID=UPI0028D9EAC4|nr:class I SAM-dependent methyltransferase [Aeromonas dhakensis]
MCNERDENIFPVQDRLDTISKYQYGYERYGYSPLSLGWDKGKQDIRFDILTNFFSLKGKRILDIGCGFGDLNKCLQEQYGDDYIYLGVDLVESFIIEARARYSSDKITFKCCDFISNWDLLGEFDVILASGIFNHKFVKADNKLFLFEIIKRSFALAAEGVAFDFLSDKVDFMHAHTFHSSPEEVLALSYSLTRNVVLRNDYFPFEFAIRLLKNDSFSVDDTTFNSWKEKK